VSKFIQGQNRIQAIVGHPYGSIKRQWGFSYITPDLLLGGTNECQVFWLMGGIRLNPELDILTIQAC
jgi:hypothetical protein